MRAESVPSAKGTYVLILRTARTHSQTVGRLGTFQFSAGYYAYVGSAFGSGGLSARVGHHLTHAPRPRWHIDYLSRISAPTEVWFTTHRRKLEQEWALLLRHMPSLRIPIDRFGSSEYHRTHVSHLFYSKKQPPFDAFARKVSGQSGPKIVVWRYRIRPN